jgi:hypothetical protein
MTGCIIQQGNVGTNRNVIDLGAENPTTNPTPSATISSCTLINDCVDGATFFWNNTSGSCSLTNNKLYAAPGTTAITVSNGSNITTTGTTTPSSRPFMDSTHPWDSFGSASGAGAASGASGSSFPGVNRRSTSFRAYNTDQTSHTINKPTGALQGDRLVVALTCGVYDDTAVTVTAPTGWVEIGDNPHGSVSDTTPYTLGIYLFYKDLGAGEPSSYSFTSSSADSEIFCYCVSGQDSSIAPKISSDNSANDGGPSIANSVTVSNNFGLAMHIAACWNSAANSSPPTNFTERYEGSILYAADRSVNSGATGTSSSAHNANLVGGGFDYWIANTVVIEAAATGTGGTIVSRAGSSEGNGSASATGRVVKNSSGSASGTSAAMAVTSPFAFGTAFGFGGAFGVSSSTKASAGIASGGGSANAFAGDPGRQDIGISTTRTAEVGPTLICYNNWADKTLFSEGSWRSTLPLSNLQNSELGRVTRSVSSDPAATQFKMDIGINRPSRAISLLNHNFSFSSQYRLRGTNREDFSQISVDTGWRPVWPTVYPMEQRAWESDNFWFGTYTKDDVEGYPWHLIILLSATKWLRYWWVEIDDVSNVNGYVQLGRVFIGDAWQPQNGVAFGCELGWEDPTPITETLSGAEYPDARSPYRVAQLTTHFMDTDEAYGKAFEIKRKSGSYKEVLFIQDANDTLHQIRRRFIGRLRSLPPNQNPYPELHTTSWEIKEILP